MPTPKLFRVNRFGGERPMLQGPPDDFVWPDSWRPLAGESFVSTLDAELQREVCPGHPLSRVACRAVARNLEDGNEFVFATAHPDMPVAFVHLTWQVERSPRYPYTMGYPSWEAFRSSWAYAVV
jgi:hypothetical protein